MLLYIHMYEVKPEAFELVHEYLTTVLVDSRPFTLHCMCLCVCPLISFALYPRSEGIEYVLAEFPSYCSHTLTLFGCSLSTL